MKSILFTIALLGVCAPSALAQELHQDLEETLQGEVLEILEAGERTILGTDTTHPYQEIRVEIIHGAREGEKLTFENDFIPLQVGDHFYFNAYTYIDGTEAYGVVNIDRSSALYLLLGIFVATVLAFGGWQGLRSLAALGGSILAILYILVPGLLGGWSPFAASALVAGVILFVAIFLTHGWNRESGVAFFGTMIAVAATGLFALFATSLTRLSGFAAEESVYLNLNTGGALDFTGLLLGAIVIGALGVLDDIAVTQAAVVSELRGAKPDAPGREIYQKAMRVGREHVGALVNTLFLAYAGAALPLLLLLYTSPTTLGLALNSEILATEIVRTISGSIGLILTVPIVTGLAVFFLKEGREGGSSHGHHHH